ncbi:hypothetical protein MLD38_019589 [Melastoma candidum]|uniref:Uncharacterized protein n=1 Tax=Melastoma candidum TaxID=119954 RepID=A0ACB9QYR1_9MYRT|nr:hypothetical protein MLD38_019589 [Melastoma candidum]
MGSHKQPLQIAAALALLVACSAILADAQFRVAKGASPPSPSPPRVAKGVSPLPPPLLPPKNWNPWQGQPIPPEPRKGYYLYLKGCAAILTDACGLEVFDYTFLRIDHLSKGCCVNLVKMGELCNKAMAITLSTLEKYKRWSGHIYKRSMDAFYECNKTVALPPLSA